MSNTNQRSDSTLDRWEAEAKEIIDVRLSMGSESEQRILALIELVRNLRSLIAKKDEALFHVGDECLGCAEKWAQECYYKTREALALSADLNVSEVTEELKRPKGVTRE